VEWHVNRIKSVKRQRNQIANFELLRIRRFDQTRYTIPKFDEEPISPDFPFLASIFVSEIVE